MYFIRDFFLIVIAVFVASLIASSVSSYLAKTKEPLPLEVKIAETCVECCPQVEFSGKFAIDGNNYHCTCRTIENDSYQCGCSIVNIESVFQENGEFKDKEDQAEYENRK